MCQKDAEKIMERCRTLEGAATAPLDLKPVINTSSYTVRENMSILRAYSLFRTMGCRFMLVVDIGNQVVGMLTRQVSSAGFERSTSPLGPPQPLLTADRIPCLAGPCRRLSPAAPRP